MRGWLSSVWEPNWRSFQYFNLYRLCVALILLACAFLQEGWLASLRVFEHDVFAWAASLYAGFVGAGYFGSLRWRKRFNFQLTLQVLGETGLLSAVMFSLGGVSSGVGLVMLITMVAAGLVGQGRLVLFYAALATLGTLCVQALLISLGVVDSASILQSGLLSAGFFATAILARLLGQRVMANEELARQRGIALATERHIGERILERMQDGVLVVDRQGHILRHNPGGCLLLGLESLEGSALEAVAPALAAGYSAWLDGGTGETEFESAARRRLRSRFVATESLGGETLIFLEDVTRIREQAQHLKLASLGRLTASIAHEIRNPLAAISHAADLLQEERRGEIHERLLRIVRDNVFRLDRIVQDVLKLGRSDRGSPEAISLAGFLSEFVGEFEVVEKVAAGIVQLEGAADATLCFDRSQLLQVVWNLVGNAVRHCQQLPGSVQVQCVVAGDERVELHILDDGPGIPPELRDQIFEPFFTTRHQGLGLGLFLARELCEANGAALRLLPAAGGHFVIVGGAQCQLGEANDGHAEN